MMREEANARNYPRNSFSTFHFPFSIFHFPFSIFSFSIFSFFIHHQEEKEKGQERRQLGGCTEGFLIFFVLCGFLFVCRENLKNVAHVSGADGDV
jgi:hypothetical protein